MTGKRIIVSWNDESFEKGSDWIAFRILDETEEGFYCEGVDSPCGGKHDGSRLFIRFEELNDWQEWKAGGSNLPNQTNKMTCSRCASTSPNRDCYVCDEPEPDEPDAFLLAKAAAIDQEIADESPLT